MIIEAIERPIRYRWSRGEIRFTPGEPVHVEPTLGQRILKKCEGKIHRVDDSPFYISQRVRYRVPVHIKSPTNYEWQHYIGTVELIDSHNEMAAIIPDDENRPWRWVSLTYIKPLERKEPKP